MHIDGLPPHCEARIKVERHLATHACGFATPPTLVTIGGNLECYLALVAVLAAAPSTHELPPAWCESSHPFHPSPPQHTLIR